MKPAADRRGNSQGGFFSMALVSDATRLVRIRQNQFPLFQITGGKMVF
jgi:hypothetical protein